MTPNSSRRRLLLLVMPVMLMFTGCAHDEPVRRTAIDVRHQTVGLLPLEGVQALTSSLPWPGDRNQAGVLRRDIMQVWKNLLVEFRRCEKYGLYTMAEQAEAATATISVAIVSARIRNDSLLMPLKLVVSRGGTAKSRSLTVDAFGLCPDCSPDSVSVYALAGAIADYRRRFPYRAVVATFCPEKTPQHDRP